MQANFKNNSISKIEKKCKIERHINRERDMDRDRKAIIEN